MTSRVARRRAAIGFALLALALHALAPLASGKPRSAEPGLHDLCIAGGAQPAAPAPASHDGHEHCTLCGQPAPVSALATAKLSADEAAESAFPAWRSTLHARAFDPASRPRAPPPAA